MYLLNSIYGRYGTHKVLASNERFTGVTPNNFVCLLRVSTHHQSADGHGIAAQRRDIESFLQHQENPTVIKELVEVQSGGKELRERPVLQEAMDLCRKTNSTLVVATLSRLSRDAAFVLNLMKDSTIKFKVSSMPSADNLQLGIYAILNEEERRQVSVRTKNALAAAKARGVKLGNPRLAEMNATRKRQSRNFADQHKDLVWSLRNKGKSLRQICEVLNDAGMKTPRGGIFYPVTITRILRRTADPALAVA